MVYRQCHPERSEGSLVDIPLLYEILHFVQNDSLKLTTNN